MKIKYLSNICMKDSPKGTNTTNTQISQAQSVQYNFKPELNEKSPHVQFHKWET